MRGPEGRRASLKRRKNACPRRPDDPTHDAAVRLPGLGRGFPDPVRGGGGEGWFA